MKTSHRPILVLLLLALVGLTLSVQAQQTEPSDLRASAIYQFSQMIAWPPGTTSAPFVIGYIGKGEVTASLPQLEKAAAGATTIHVQEFTDPKAAAAGCQILVIGDSADHDLATILDAVKNHPVLTVGNSEGFAAKGGCIGFFTDRNRLRFNLNSAAMQRANLKPNAHLLSLASVIKGP